MSGPAFAFLIGTLVLGVALSLCLVVLWDRYLRDKGKTAFRLKLDVKPGPTAPPGYPIEATCDRCPMWLSEGRVVGDCGNERSPASGGVTVAIDGCSKHPYWTQPTPGETGESEATE